MTSAPPVVVIFGPTAVGKTDLLLRLFSESGGVEVIAADSMQVYRHLDVGTAKPGPEVLRRLPHHLIGVVDPKEQFNAGEFVRRADALVREVREKGRVPVISGGTAYYLRSFLYGLPDAPPGDAKVRRGLKRELAERGLEPLLEELGRVDPESRRRIAPRDSYRVLRALEVWRTAGRALTEFRRPDEPRAEYRALLVGLQRGREELYRRIDERVEAMFAAGLAEEVRGLLAAGYGPEDPGMRGIGYREFFSMKAGCLSWSGLKELIQGNSRRYAKRQLTFFRSIPGVAWFDPEDVESMRGAIEGFLEAEHAADAPPARP
ncbi:MAG: tRNA (adenosine(37)-N6)-dimethylallyltransferase MiaA [Spirochaetales bacterium]|nr:tRNA (adenosine(37)-N6)-dimethylallyltransferase MiaA [Spirochaetales bacterium]